MVYVIRSDGENKQERRLIEIYHSCLYSGEVYPNPGKNKRSGLIDLQIENQLRDSTQNWWLKEMSARVASGETN
jgi:hypothetical protein